MGSHCSRDDGIDVRVVEETVWLTQRLIGVLFDKGRSTVTEHLKNIFETGELDQKAAGRDFRHTSEDQAEQSIPMTMKDWTTRKEFDEGQAPQMRLKNRSLSRRSKYRNRVCFSEQDRSHVLHQGTKQ